MSLLRRDSWQEAWQLAVELTVEELQQADLEERCAKSGGIWKPEEGTAEITFLNREYHIRPPEFEIVLAPGEEQVPITERILILHYLKNATGVPPSGEWITFAQVPGGDLYLANFRARSVDRMLRAFSGREETLVEESSAIGGLEAAYGDVSVHLLALPRVPVALVLWRGDEEFSASGNLLYDATVTQYLSTEDMVVLAGTVVSRLCR